MILAWMIYSFLIGVLVLLPALAVDRVCASLGLPRRAAWALALVVAVTVSALAWPVHRITAAPAPASAPAALARFGGVAGALRVPLPFPISRLSSAMAELWSRLGGLAALDLVLRWTVPGAAFLASAYLVAVFLQLRGVVRRGRRDSVGGQSVVLADGVGPAVIGPFRSVIILPRWVVSLPADDQHLIVAHEREHASARDPAVLFAAALLAALEPWNPALWLIFSRLRLAIEADCDGRMLRAGADRLRYANLLVSVQERTARRMTPAIAFFTRPSSLRRRVSWVMHGAPRVRSTGGVALLASGLAAALFACATPNPKETSRRSDTAACCSTVALYKEGRVFVPGGRIEFKDGMRTRTRVNDVYDWSARDVVVTLYDGRVLKSPHITYNGASGEYASDTTYTITRGTETQSGVGLRLDSSFTRLRCLKSCTGSFSALLPRPRT